MGNLLKSPHLFATWWLIKTPKKIALVIRRILMVLNSQLSFTVNLRLIFTPLFGDYTVVGRCIGFTVRIVEIVFGVAIMAVIAVLYPILPLLWLALPLVLLYKIGVSTILIYTAVYLFWSVSMRNTPEKRTKECTDVDFLKSFRPSGLALLNRLAINTPVTIEKLAEFNKIQILLARLELTNTDFLAKLSK